MKKENYEGRITPYSSCKDDPWTQLLIERYTLSAYFCKGRFVLDSCCGTGWGTVKFIAPVAKQVVGFDLYPPSVTDPYDKNNCSFHTMDAKKIKLDKANFDIALALDSIEHVGYDDGADYLKGIKSVLKKEGILLGSTPLVEQKCLIPIFLGWNKYHLYMYTENVLKRALLSHFQHTNIYRIYNEVCPYFFFACSDSKNELSIIDSTINQFTLQNEQRFSLGKRSAYRLWAKHLLKHGRIDKALNYLISSFKN